MFVQKVIAEVMHSLLFATLLPIATSSGGNGKAEAAAMFVSLSKLQAMAASGTAALKTAAGKRGALLDSADASRLLGLWTPTTAVLPRYDVFLSYRWGAHDSLLTMAVFDAVSALQLGGRALSVFLDTQRLQVGEQLQTQFARAMVSSTVVAAFVTSDALERMVTHDPTQEDNVLVEFMVAQCCFRSEASRVSKVYPIFVGLRGRAGRGSVASMGDLWKSGVLQRLPDTVPAASIAKAAALLQANGVAPSPEMQRGSLTVKAVVGEMTSMLAFVAKDVPKESRVVAEYAYAVWKLLSAEAARAEASAAAGGTAAVSGHMSPSASLPALAAAAAGTSNVEIEKLAAFFEDVCGISMASSRRYAEALVLQHDVASVKRLQHLQKSGKLADVAKQAGIADVDLEVLQEELAVPR